MIDFVKVKLLNRELISRISKEKKLEGNLKSKYNYATQSNEYSEFCIDNLLVRITKKSAYLKNSLHKNFNLITNGSLQNYNDFNYCNLICYLDSLEERLGYDLSKTSITNLEFGFNIPVDKLPYKYIEENILMYNFKDPCYNPKNDKNKKIKKFTYDQYEIKLYDKSLESRISGNILRIEIKIQNEENIK